MSESRIPSRINALAHEVTGSGETVLFDQTGNQLLVLNETAATIWLLVDGQRSVSDMVELVTETIAVSPDVEQEVVTFLTDLESKGLISWQ